MIYVCTLNHCGVEGRILAAFGSFRSDPVLLQDFVLGHSLLMLLLVDFAEICARRNGHCRGCSASLASAVSGSDGVVMPQ